MAHALGIDVGGTFTDFAAYDQDRKVVEVWKELSVPTDPVIGILEGLARYREDAATVTHMRLGTTVATNAILERTGATVAYVATKGFRDIIFVQRGNRKYHYDMSWVKPKPLAKRRDCFEVDERVDAYGNIIKPLDENEVRALGRRLAAVPEIQAVAVCLLFSYLNPAHEVRIKEILTEMLPGKAISISYDVLPKWKEYERASTTLADAYLKPPEQARAIVAPLYDALNEPLKKDVTGLLARAANSDYRSCSTNQDCLGRDKLADQFRFFGAIIPDLHWAIKDVWTSGDQIVVRGEATGTPVAPLFGTKPTGKSFRTISIDMFTVRNGKLATAYHVEDWAAAMQQISQ